MASTEVLGLRQLEQVLLNLPRSTAKGVVRRSMTKAAEPMRDLAARLAPDDPATHTPDLHTSFAIGNRSKGGRGGFRREGPREVAIYIGPTREGYPQAIMMEFGTFKDRAQPSLGPAWEQEQRPMLERFAVLQGQELDKTIARIRRRSGG